MRILITAAEKEELDCALTAYKIVSKTRNIETQIDYILTGIGATSTAYSVTKKIYEAKIDNLNEEYSLALNIGIAGSFNMKNFPLKSVGVVEKEYFGDLGFETFTGFQTLFDYKILGAETFPYKNGALNIESTCTQECIGKKIITEFTETLPKVVGVTVQTVTGNPLKVEQVYNLFNPQIESMEGAAFYYVCINEHLPAFEMRSISNAVGERNRANWDIPGALQALQEECVRFMELLK